MTEEKHLSSQLNSRYIVFDSFHCAVHGFTWPSFAFARFFSHWVLLPRDLNKLFDLFSLSQDSKVRPEKGIFHTIGRDEIKLLGYV